MVESDSNGVQRIKAMRIGIHKNWHVMENSDLPFWLPKIMSTAFFKTYKYGPKFHLLPKGPVALCSLIFMVHR